MPTAAPLPLDSPYLPELIRRLNTETARSVARQGIGTYGFCYWNAKQAAAQVGGFASPGWAITWMPGLFVQANHHAIWVSSDQTMMRDVTHSGRPDDTDETLVLEHAVTFLPDRPNAHILDLRYPVNIANEYIVISEHPDVLSMVEANRRHTTIAQDMTQKLRDLGGTWSPEGGWSSLPFPPPVQLQPMGEALQAAQQDYMSAWQRLELLSDRQIER